MEGNVSRGVEPAPRGRARALRTAEMREKLLKAARQLFVSKGYHATRPQDISRIAGVGYGTFYQHFEDKQACFLAFSLQAQDELDAFILERIADRAPTSGLLDSLEAGLDALCEYSEKNPGMLPTILTDLGVIAAGAAPNESLFNRWCYGWSQLIKHLLKEQKLEQDVRPHTISLALAAVCTVSLDQAVAKGIPRQEIVHDFAQFMLNAMCVRHDVRSEPDATANRILTHGRIPLS